MSIWTELSKPFPVEAVSWRVGSTTKDKTKGMMLAYISARDVMERLDEVVGPENWGDTYEETPSGRVICSLTVWFADDDYTGTRSWVIKSDGAGDTDVEGEKGGISDAFKRAAVKFGVGRYLYHLDSPWVELDEWKKPKKGQETKLLAVLKKHTQEWGKKAQEAVQKAPQATPRERSGNSAPKQEDAPDASEGPSGEKETVDQFAKRKEAEIRAKEGTDLLFGPDDSADQPPVSEQPWENVRRVVPDWAPFDGPYFRGKKGGDPGFLDLAGAEKNRIGSRLYYKLLRGFKLNKASDITQTNKKLQGKVLGYLKAMPDLNSESGFSALCELILEEANERKDEVLITTLVEKMREIGDKPTKKRIIQIGDELEIIMGADDALNEETKE